MKDLTTYSDKELSLIVFNNEYLYSKMMQFYDNKSINTTFALTDLLVKNGYKYTNKQWSNFVSDINSHTKELEQANKCN